MGVTVVSVMFRLSNGRSIELTLAEMAALREQFERIGVAVQHGQAQAVKQAPACAARK